MKDILKGFIYPIFSHDFYQKAVTFSTRKILVFVFLFTVLMGLFGTLVTGIRYSPQIIEVAKSKDSIIQYTQDFIQTADFNQISVTNGQLSIDLQPQPYIYTGTEQIFQFIIDTTDSFDPTLLQNQLQNQRFVLITKDKIVVQQKRGNSYKTDTVYWKDMFTEDIVVTKKELTTLVSPLLDTIFVWGWIIIALFILIILPIFKMFLIFTKLAIFVLLFSIIISLILPKNIAEKRGSIAFKLSVFLFVPIFYIASMIVFFLSLLPSEIALFLVIFKLTWFPLALFWLEFIAKRSALVSASS